MIVVKIEKMRTPGALEPAASAGEMQVRMRVIKKERLEKGSNWRLRCPARKKGLDVKATLTLV
jgi:hypothetical protein